MASKHDHHWAFGNHAHISFAGGGNPADSSPATIKTEEGCASISDSNGNLLFYTDGTTLFNAAGATVPITSSSLGGDNSSCHSALIVPRAGGGNRYHIFGVRAWEPIQPTPSRLCYTAVTVSSGIVTVVAQPATLPFGPDQVTERLAAISHQDCDKYWLVYLNSDHGSGKFHSLLIDSDALPNSAPTHWKSSPYPSPWPSWHQQYMKFSPDGSLLALVSRGTIDVMNFDRSTGLVTGGHSQITGTSGANAAYGLEFSPDGKYLYFTGLTSGEVRRQAVLPGPHPLSGTDLIATLTSPAAGPKAGALQLSSNGKIYGIKVGQNGLFEIGAPNSSTVPGALYNLNAVAANGSTLAFAQATGRLGLPTFTRIPADCDDRCSDLAAEVNEVLEDRAHLQNSMATCKGEPPQEPQCHPLEIPELRPQTYISWGNSKCDCIEGDDTEIMYLTVCNPYSNLTLSNLTVYELVVVDSNGNPVPNLPDGSPSIQLVPIGPYCFDDIAPCTCVSREFMLRLRGAPGGPYQIRVKGICFDACLHGDTEACFQFDVCKD